MGILSMTFVKGWMQWCLKSLLCLSLAGQVHASTVLYQQNFRHPSEVPADSANVRVPDSIGWTSYYGATATNITQKTSNDRSSVLIGWTDGSPAADGPGYLYTREAHTSTITFRNFATVTPVFSNAWNPDDGAIQVSFRGNVSHPGIGVQVLAQIGGQWYVQNVDMALPIGTQGSLRDNTTSVVTSMSRSFELQLLANQWSVFNLLEGSVMSEGGSATQDLSGPITRMGFYVTNPETSTSGTTYFARLDSLMVTQVPEPKLGLLLLMGVSGLLLRRTR